MIKYKLTNQKMQTHNGCQWEIGVAKTTDGIGELCNSGWLHFYDDPILAVFLNPIHADIQNPRIFECNAEGEFKDNRGLKGGCTELTLVREIELPKVSRVQRIAFGILCAKHVFKDKKWSLWADNWLDGTDRSTTAAITTHAAASTLNSFSDYTDYTARAAAYAAYAAFYAAAYAAYAAFYATYPASEFNLIEIAHKSMTIQ